MGTRHPHADLIKAWADGADIEVLCLGGWKPAPDPSWSESLTYRVKPDPYKVFKDALAAGERVDMAIDKASHRWAEVLPTFSDWQQHKPEYFRVALPWQDERDAYARGEDIQCRRRRMTIAWYDMQTGPPRWLPDYEYRVKPKPKVETFVVARIAQFVPGEGPSYAPAPFNMPTISLDIEHRDGVISNITIKEWHQ